MSDARTDEGFYKICEGFRQRGRVETKGFDLAKYQEELERNPPPASAEQLRLQRVEEANSRPEATTRLRMKKDFLDYKAGEEARATLKEARTFIDLGVAGAIMPELQAALELSAEEARERFKGRKSFGDFLRAVSRRDNDYLKEFYGSDLTAGVANKELDERGLLSAETKAALAGDVARAGGYTLPLPMYQDILATGQELEPPAMRPGSMVLPMTSATLLVPYLDITSTPSAGASPFAGQLSLTWSGENRTKSENDPAFKQLELHAWELSGVVTVSNTLLQDGLGGPSTCI